MLFSDNVSLEDEIALKRYARERKLLLMGRIAARPSLTACRSAFANRWRAGEIGCIAGSGTGCSR